MPAPARSSTRQPHWLAGYADYSRSALASLLFVFPLLIIHEIGIHYWGLVSGRLIEHRIAAYALICKFFDLFGSSMRYLPALTVVAVLLAEHIARRQRWVFNSPALALMACESMLLAIPLIAVYWIAGHTLRFHWPPEDWKLLASMYLGAGIYEELVFRLGTFVVLSLLLVDLLKMPQRWGTPLIVVIAAIAFAAYHLLGTAQLPWQSFVFITLRGVYYGTIFVHRGFGLSVGVHTSYDLICGLFMWENWR